MAQLQYGLTIQSPQGVAIQEGPQGTYAYLQHGAEFSYVLSNPNNFRCNVEVKIQGKDVGVWRLKSKQTGVVIDRPARVPLKLRFYCAGSTQANEAGIVPGADSNALIEATFIPEASSDMASSPAGAQEGIVGLEGESKTVVRSAPAMKLDRARAQSLYIRLACK